MMQEAVLTEKKEETLIKKALNKVLALKGFEKIRANMEGFETPARLVRADSGDSYIPDITGLKNGTKSYFEIAVKNPKKKATVSKWKLLSQLAKLRNGKFYLLVPRGNYAFVQRLMDKYPIEAQVVKY